MLSAIEIIYKYSYLSCFDKGYRLTVRLVSFTLFIVLIAASMIETSYGVKTVRGNALFSLSLYCDWFVSFIMFFWQCNRDYVETTKQFIFVLKK